MKSGILIFIIVILALVGAFFFFNSPKGEDVVRDIDTNITGDAHMQGDMTSAPSDSDLVPVGGGLKGEDIEAAAVIRRVEGGYEPSDVTISQGEVVSFVNDTDDPHWPASNVHPTHQIYSAFDPREPIESGATWSFVFDEAGEWKFHDHLRANFTGVVRVLPREQN